MLRNLTRGGFAWANEVSEYALYLITLLTAPWLLRRGQHVRLDLVLTLVPPRVAWLMEAVGDSLGFAVCLVLVRYGLAMTYDSCAARRDHHQEPGVSGMVAAGAAAGDFRAARDRVRVPLRIACCAGERGAPHRGHVGGLTDELGRGEPAAVRRPGRLMGARPAGRLRVPRLNIVGALLFLGGEPGLPQLARNAVQSVTSFSLTPIPFFVLMGEVLFHTGVALKAIDAFALLIRRVPGRLAVIAIVAGTVFSAISGSTIATTALLGSLMLPTMLARGYEPRMAMGPIMGIGGVDMLIPPSALTVLLGSLAGISISGLLIGGIVPGLILSVLFVGYIIVRAALNPALAPDERAGRSGRAGLARWRPFVIHVLPLLLIFGAGGRRDDRAAGRRRPKRPRSAPPAPSSRPPLYRSLTCREPDEGAHRHGRDLRHHPVHHRRRHHLLAGAELLRRRQRHRRAGRRAGAVGRPCS